MDNSGWPKVFGVLVVVGLAFGVRWYSKWDASSEVREAMYQRYSELGDPESVKKLVDQHHPEAFDECYRMGWKRRKSSFDAEKYADLMDRKVRTVLERARTAERVAAHQKEAAERRAALEQRAAARAPATVPAAAAHGVNIETITARAARSEELRPAAFESDQYVLEVLVADEANDITPEDPPSYMLEIRCDATGTISTPGGRPDKVTGMGRGRAVLPVHVIVPTTSAAGRPCHALVRVTDKAGNQSGLEGRTLPAR